MSGPHEHSHKDPACLEVFARLSEYLDGELPAADCAEIEAHIADCPACIEFLDSLKRSVGATHQFAGTLDPAPLAPASRERLQAAWKAALTRRAG